MDNYILRNFHQRTLSLYRPQAEKFLNDAEPDLLRQVSFRYTFSVEAMIHISRVIEDMALTNPRVAEFHASFQYLSRLQPQQDRYEQIAKAVKELYLYYTPDVDGKILDRRSNVVHIDTTYTSLVDYWFVVIYGPGISMSLLAEEVASLGGPDRYYEGFYTFESDVAYQIITILHRSYPGRIPKPMPPEQFTIKD